MKDFVIVTILTLLFGGVLLSYGFAKGYNTPPMSSTSIHDEVNAIRLENGQKPLRYSEQLEDSACAKAKHMVDNNYWEHIAPDGTTPWVFIANEEYAYKNAGENLSAGYITSKDVVKAWMASQKHKDNILGDYTEQGLCIYGSGDKLRLGTLVVQHLAEPEQ